LIGCCNMSHEGRDLAMNRAPVRKARLQSEAVYALTTRLV
jgi:hypothetical protein